MRRAKLFMLLAAAAAFGSISLAGIAEAHSRPVRFDPSPGAVLDATPSEVTGWFTSDIRRAEESFIQVLDADGTNVATGETQLSEDRREMSTAVQPGLADGRYVVYWSTFDDADGEVFSDCYAFYVGQAAADEAVANGEGLDAAADCPSTAESDDHAHDDEGATTDSGASVDFRVMVNGSDAELTILPVNFTPRAPDGSTVDPNFGHYHIYLDKVPVDVLTGEYSHDEDMEMSDDEEMTDDQMADDEMSDTSGSLVENPVMWVENSYTFTDLEPGVHTVSVVLNYDNHEPFDPPVIASQSFTVGGAGGDDDGGIPAWTLVIAVVGGLAAGGIGMKLAGGRA